MKIFLARQRQRTRNTGAFRNVGAAVVTFHVLTSVEAGPVAIVLAALVVTIAATRCIGDLITVITACLRGLRDLRRAWVELRSMNESSTSTGTRRRRKR